MSRFQIDIGDIYYMYYGTCPDTGMFADIYSISNEEDDPLIQVGWVASGKLISDIDSLVEQLRKATTRFNSRLSKNSRNRIGDALIQVNKRWGGCEPAFLQKLDWEAYSRLHPLRSYLHEIIDNLLES